MILTETLFRKIISFAVLQETQNHTELMAQASAVLKRAHKRGVELEYILEVRLWRPPLPSPVQHTPHSQADASGGGCSVPQVASRALEVSQTQHPVGGLVPLARPLYSEIEAVPFCEFGCVKLNFRLSVTTFGGLTSWTEILLIFAIND